MRQHYLLQQQGRSAYSALLESQLSSSSSHGIARYDEPILKIKQTKGFKPELRPDWFHSLSLSRASDRAARLVSKTLAGTSLTSGGCATAKDMYFVKYVSRPWVFQISHRYGNEPGTVRKARPLEGACSIVAWNS